MIFNRRFVVGEYYWAETGEKFCVEDIIEGSARILLPFKRHHRVVFRRNSTGELLHVRLSTAQRLPLKKVDG